MNEPMNLDIHIDLRELLHTYGGDDEPMSLADSLLSVAAGRLIQQLPSDLKYELSNRARTITDDEIKQAIRPLIAAAIEGGIQRTNSYGEPKGDPVTLAEAITETARQALTKPSANNGIGAKPTLLQAILKDEVERVVGRELREAVDAAKVEVKAAVQAEAAKIIADTITRVAR